MFPPANRGYEPEYREPELLTHAHGMGPAWQQDHAAQQRFDAFAPEADPEPSPPPGDEEVTELAHAGLSKQERRRRVIRWGIYGSIIGFVLLPIAIFTIMYFFVDVPSPYEVAATQNKTVTYTYDDSSLMAKDMQSGNRVLLQPESITEVVKHAAMAAEDETFQTNPGFDILGILRAVKSQLTGGSGGGSTITQQYIKNATGEDDVTITRKATEIVKAFKLSNQMSKQEIITGYLNTIYFGRGAYGIQAAAQSYFGTDAEKLTTAQAAYLAGIIQAPSNGDAYSYVRERWNYVLDQMVQNQWISPSERASAKFPMPISLSKAEIPEFSGPRSNLKDALSKELASLGYSEEQVRSAGYTIHTTIDRRAQRIAENVVEQVMKGQPTKLHEAFVAQDPRTGGVKAYYGGPYDQTDYINWADQARNPGSTMKAFDFVGALKLGIGPWHTYNGTSPRKFGDVVVRNSEGDQCPDCTVFEGMKRSINTVFYDMVYNDVHPRGVVKAAHQAGISNDSSVSDLDGNIAIGGGDNKITPQDMAAAYSTFAANGIRRDSHLVSKITTPDGDVVYQADRSGEPAFSPDPQKSKQIAGNVTMTLEPVLAHSDLRCGDGRDCAGKTGTHEAPGYPGQNSQAWMVGYSGQISAAAWVGDSALEPATDKYGSPLYGSTLPGDIWQMFMNQYLDGMPELSFPEVELIGEPPPPPPEPEPTYAPTTAPEETTTTTTAPEETTTTTAPEETTTTEEEEEEPPGNGNGEGGSIFPG